LYKKSFELVYIPVFTARPIKMTSKQGSKRTQASTVDCHIFCPIILNTFQRADDATLTNRRIVKLRVFEKIQSTTTSKSISSSKKRLYDDGHQWKKVFSFRATDNEIMTLEHPFFGSVENACIIKRRKMQSPISQTSTMTSNTTPLVLASALASTWMFNSTMKSTTAFTSTSTSTSTLMFGYQQQQQQCKCNYYTFNKQVVPSFPTATIFMDWEPTR
jgi:hypothetical protein